MKKVSNYLLGCDVLGAPVEEEQADVDMDAAVSDSSDDSAVVTEDTDDGGAYEGGDEGADAEMNAAVRSAIAVPGGAVSDGGDGGDGGAPGDEEDANAEMDAAEAAAAADDGGGDSGGGGGGTASPTTPTDATVPTPPVAPLTGDALHQEFDTSNQSLAQLFGQAYGAGSHFGAFSAPAGGALSTAQSAAARAGAPAQVMPTASHAAASMRTPASAVRSVSAQRAPVRPKPAFVKTTAVSRGATRVRGDEDGPSFTLASELPGVSDEDWTKFVYAMRSAPVGAVSPSNGLGMFSLKPRRLEDLGLVMNLSNTRDPKTNRMIYVCDFIPPLTAKRFLSDPALQYKTFVRSMKDYASKLGEESVPKPDGGFPDDMSMAGALAVLHRCGPSGLKTWNDVDRRFPDTVTLYEKTNGVF